ncbi:hypothetical protein ACHQM5_013465 [Ranunculus cassubicifolius]
MGDFGRIDSSQLISYSEDLIQVLKNKKDTSNLVQCFERGKKLQSFCEAESYQFQNLLQEYEKKINSCEQRIEETKGESVNDDDIKALENELEEDIQKKLSLVEELRVVNNQISDLERQRLSVDDQKQILTKRQKDESRAQRKLSAELSSYASVTKVIPSSDVYDQTKISGHIVDGNKNLVEKFEFDPLKAPSFEICNNLWKMIDQL